MKRERGYMPFGYKLMLTYCIFIVFPISLVGYLANSIFVQSVREQTRSNIQGTLDQMHDNITYRLEDVQRISDLLYFDDTLAKQVREYGESWTTYQKMINDVLPRLQTAIEATSRHIWLSVYMRNDSLPEIYNDYSRVDPLAVRGRSFDIYHLDRIAHKSWYEEFPEEKYGVTMAWRQIEDDALYNRISLMRRLIDIRHAKQHEIGFIRISVYLSELFESLNTEKIGDGSIIVVMDERNRRIAAFGEHVDSLPDMQQSPLAFENYQLIESPLPQLGWRLVALIPNDITEGDTNKLRWLTVLVCLVCFVVFFIGAIPVSRYYSRRVYKILSVLDAFKAGAFNKRMQFGGKDEFARISSAINDMGRSIDQLIREVYMTNIRKKEAELESLQAQINPHFLYNTLSSISRLAKFGKLDKLQGMIMNLAKFYRLSLNEGRTVIPIAHELEQVLAYIDIQKIKYEDRMIVDLDIAPEARRFATIKLILQPFVENALEHAWYGDRIHIRLTCSLEQDTVVFKVIDDGFGIHPDKLRRIADPNDGPEEGYGIRNVDQRIKLHYGKAYGVTIMSRLGIGTTVQITIPAGRGS